MTIFVGLGSNMADKAHGPPAAILEAAIAHMNAVGLSVVRRSSFWRSAPVPPSDSIWYLNAVVSIEADRKSQDVLDTLLDIERSFGRERRYRGQARTLDLDLIDWRGVSNWEDFGGAEALRAPDAGARQKAAITPHPRMHMRAFVLAPLQEIAPDWTHPALGASVGDLLAAAARDQPIERLAADRDDAA